MKYWIQHCRTPISYNHPVLESTDEYDLHLLLAVQRGEIVFQSAAAAARGNPHVLKVWREVGFDGKVILMEDRQFQGHWISNTLKEMLRPKVEDVYAD